ncbi:MAG: efflux RND transporter periplasmic adaptor subunit [Burkholderiales bacterium]
MKRRTLFVTGILAAGVAAAGTVIGPRLLREPHEERPVPSAPAATNGTQLRFPAGAPQLAFIRTESAGLAPEALTEALPGRLAYDENATARVTAPIVGRVASIAVQLGDHVAKGATLAVLDAPDFTQALADIKRDELEVKQKRSSFERARMLYQGEVLSRKEFEVAETDLREAEVDLARARQRVESLGQGGADAGGHLVLRAPVAGIVTERAINPGTQVGPDADKPLFVVSDPTRLRVLIDLPETQLAAARAGVDVVVTADAYPSKSFTARIDHVSDVLDPSTRRVQARGRIANPDRLLKPEMYVRVTPVAGAGQQRVRLPNTAVVTAGVKSFVFVETERGVFERRVVVPSFQGREFVFLKDGVAAGERVVVSGALLLNSELQGG